MRAGYATSTVVLLIGLCSCSANQAVPASVTREPAKDCRPEPFKRVVILGQSERVDREREDRKSEDSLFHPLTPLSLRSILSPRRRMGVINYASG